MLYKMGTGELVRRYLFLLVGLFIMAIGVGVGVEVLSRVAILAGDGLVLAIYHGVLKVELVFRHVKICFDISFVLVACIVSLVFLHELAGVREGTVAAALLFGAAARPTIKLLMPLERKYLRPLHNSLRSLNSVFLVFFEGKIGNFA